MKRRTRQFIAMLLAIVFAVTPCISNCSDQIVKAQESSIDKIYDGDGFQAQFILDTTYEGGFQARIQLKNTGKKTIQNWTLRFQFNSVITYIWNASVVKQERGVYYIKNAGWNQDIKQGETVEFGFTGSTAGVLQNPAGYEILESKSIVDDLDYQISSHFTNNWESGYEGKLVIVNSRDTAIEDWSVEFDYTGEISQFYNAEITSHVGSHYVVENAGYNGDLSAGETIELGFQGTGKCGNIPSEYTLWERTVNENVIDEISNSSESSQIVSGVPVESIEPSQETHLPVESERPTESAKPLPVESVKSSEELPVQSDGIESSESITVTESIVPTAELSASIMPPETDDLPEEYMETVLYPVMIRQGITAEEMSNVAESDYDQDGLSNYSECGYGTDPGLTDTDGDGLSDYEEIYVYKTNPLQYDTDDDGMGDGTEVLNQSEPLNKDSDGDGILDGEERVTDQLLTDEVYQELDFIELGVTPSISVTGKGDYSSQIRLENESYNGLYEGLDYLVSPVIQFEHSEDMEYEGATISFKIGEEILQSHNIEDLSIIRFEDGNAVPVDSVADIKTGTVKAQVDELCEYAVEDKAEREGVPGYLKNNDEYEVIFVADTASVVPAYFEHQFAFLYQEIEFIDSDYYKKGDNVRVGLITYHSDTGESYNHGWKKWLNYYIEKEFLLLDYYKTTEGSLQVQQESKAKVLDEAYQMFSDNNCKKLIVFVGDGENYEDRQEEPLVEEFRDKCKKSGDISLAEVIYYRNSEEFAMKYSVDFSLYEGDTIKNNTYSLVNHPFYQARDGKTTSMGSEFGRRFAEYRKLKLYSGNYLLGTEEEETAEYVRLSSGEYVKVSIDPSVDTDGDGIPDQTELADQTGECYDSKGNVIQVYNYRSNPAKADTDGDGIVDGEDGNPKTYDVTVAGYGDAGVVRLNTGKAFQILFSEEYSLDQFMKEYCKRYVSLDKAELEGIYLAMQNAEHMDFTMAEYECMHLLDEGLVKYLVQNKSVVYKSRLFERFSGKKVLDVVTGTEQIGDASRLSGYVVKQQVLDYFSVTVKWQGVWLDYFDSTIHQILLGKYSKTEGTIAGTVGQIGVAFSGVDVAQDIRDLMYDVSHWESTWEHIGETALDGICLLPVVGALAKSDEVVLLIKHTEKLYEIRRIARVGETVADVFKKVTATAGNMVDSAKVGMRQLGDEAYRCLLNALDNVKQGGRLQLCTEYGNDFTKAFTSYGDELGELAKTHPTAVQKAYRETIEECTDANGRVVKSTEEIGDISKKHIDEVAAVTDEEIYNAGLKIFNEFNIENAYVKNKHLATALGKYNKFIAETKEEAEILLRNILKNGKIVQIQDNGLTKLNKQSYRIFIESDIVIGLKEETKVRIVLSEDGTMISAFPD